MVAHQIEAVLDDIGADAIKTGMLFGEETIRAVVRTLEKRFGKAAEGGRERAKVVVDPVCVSTSGHSLLPLEAVDTLRTLLLPFALVLTPNIPEAEFLVGWQKGNIKSIEDMQRCAAELGSKGVRWVYLKGGHMPLPKGEDGTKVVVDLLWDSVEQKATTEERPFLDVLNTHGTGCTLAAAVAAELARGKTGAQCSVRTSTFAGCSNDSGSQSPKQSFPPATTSHPPSPRPILSAAAPAL